MIQTHNNRWFSSVLIFVGLLCGGYFLHQKSYLKLEQTTSYFLYPLILFHGNIVEPLKGLLQHNRSINALQDRVELLNTKWEQLLADNIALRAQLQFTKDTKEVISFKKRYAYENAIVSQILVRNFSDHEHYFLVNGGTQQGIEVDMVAVYNNCIVGKVTHAFAWYSKVTLLTDRKCKIACHCTKTKAEGIHLGNNNLESTQLSHVTHLSTIEDGDIVLSNGQGLVFPRGFALGKVTSSRKIGLYYDVSIEPLIDLKSMTYCLILPRSVH